MKRDEKDVETPKTIIVDFDGTICGNAYPDTGPPEVGVQNALMDLHSEGFRIVVHSVRTATNWGWASVIKHTKIICDYMEKHGLIYDEILCDPTYNKPMATAYIDDRGVGYRGNWTETVADVLELTKERV